MEKYHNRSGNSGITEFEIGDDHIKVRFRTPQQTFIYSYRKAGRVHVEMMKKLARSGFQLNTYINKHVKDLFD